MAFKDRLKEALDDRGMKAVDLARATELSEAIISEYLKGKKEPRGKQSVLIAKALDMSLDDLWETGFHANQNEDPDFSIPGLLPLPKTTKRPLIGTIACGEPVLAEENIEGQVDVPEHIRCDFVLRCKGDSMIGARIQDGDLVYIHQQPEVEAGEIAAVLLDGTEATLKRFYRSGDTITLVAENPAYAPIVVTKDRQFRILGKAVGFTSLIR